MEVKRRSYDARGRRARAEGTRRQILEAAHELFVDRGYAATTMTAVAERAGVALDTVYASVGRKPAVVRALVERALSGATSPVDAEQRDYVRAIRAEPDARRKIEQYALALASVHARLAPVHLVVRDAGTADPELAAQWQAVSDRRADNMRRFVADLASTGSLRPGLDHETAADTIWATNSPEVYDLLVRQRGWSADRYTAWLTDTWVRLLLG